jgi:phosphatidylinositol-3-phosphatase
MISPSLCDDMHGDTGCPSTSEVTQGHTWLSTEAAKIVSSLGAKDVLFIVWDEQTGSVGNASTPMLLIAVSPLVKSGTASTQAYTHESLLATFEESFGLARLANAAQVPNPINDVWK